MTEHARLVATRVPKDPEGLVLVLHGGASRRGDMRVSPTQLSVLRMIPIARRIARVGNGRLAVFRLLNSTRGWDTSHTPVDDVRWAMTRLRDRLGVVSTCLVGHSLGGRAALLAAGDTGVRSAVALAPWVYPTDADIDVTGRQILIVHGAKDRIAKPASSLTVARTLRRTATVGYVRIADGKHAMLHDHSTFDGLAAEFAASTLLGTTPHGVVARVLAGAELVEV